MTPDELPTSGFLRRQLILRGPTVFIRTQSESENTKKQEQDRLDETPPTSQQQQK